MSSGTFFFFVTSESASMELRLRRSLVRPARLPGKLLFARVLCRDLCKGLVARPRDWGSRYQTINLYGLLHNECQAVTGFMIGNPVQTVTNFSLVYAGVYRRGKPLEFTLFLPVLFL